VEKDGVKKMSLLTADAVELGRRVLELIFIIAAGVCIYCRCYMSSNVTIQHFYSVTEFYILCLVVFLW